MLKFEHGFFMLILRLKKSLHAFGNGDVEHGEHVFDGGLCRQAKGNSCLHKLFVITAAAACVIEFVECGSNVHGIFCDVRRVIKSCGFLDFAGECRNAGNKGKLFRLFKHSGGNFARKGHAFGRKAFKNGAYSCVSLLNIVNGVLA